MPRLQLLVCASAFAALLAATSAAADKSAKQINVGALLDSRNRQLRAAFHLAMRRATPARGGGVSWQMAAADMSNPLAVEWAIRRDYQQVAGLVIVGSGAGVQDLAANLNMPVVMATATVSERRDSRSGLVFEIRPRFAPRAAIDIALAYGWRQAIYLVNSPAGLDRAAKASAMASQAGLELATVYLSGDLTELGLACGALDIDQLDGKRRRRAIVDLEPAELATRQLIAELSGAGLNRREFHYLLADGSAGLLDTRGLLHSGVAVTGLQLLGLARREIRDLKKRWDLISRHVKYRENIDKQQRKASPLPNDEAADSPTLLTVALIMDAVKAVLTSVEAIQQQSGESSGIEADIPTVRRWLRRHLAHSLDFHGYTGRLAFRPDSGERANISAQVLQLTGPEGFQHLAEWRSDTTPTRLPARAAAIASSGGFPAGSVGVKQRNRTATLNKPLRWPSLIRVVTIESKPFVQPRTVSADDIENDDQPAGNDTEVSGSVGHSGPLPFEGFCVELLEKISERVGGLRYTVHLVRDGQYGGKNASASADAPEADKWNGMIGELLRDTADVALAPLTINTERSKVVDFTEPFLTFGISIMIKKPRKEKPGNFGFLQPLSQMWPYMLTGGAGVIAGLYLCARLSPMEWRITDAAEETAVAAPEDEQQQNLQLLRKRRRDFSMFNSLWFALAAILNQGVDLAPRSFGARVVTSVWWFFTLIMIAYYTAILAASLTVELLRTPVDSWHDLLSAHDKTGMLFGTIASGSTQAFFLSTKIWPYSGIGAIMRSNVDKVYANTTASGVQRVRESNGGYAFLLESKMNEFHNNRDPCDTMMVGQPFGDNGYGIATQRGSPLRELLNDAILQLREQQVLAELYKKWWIEKGQCASEDSGGGSAGTGGATGAGDGNQSPLAVINVAGVFYILIAGLGAALAAALAESLCSAAVQRRNRRRSQRLLQLERQQRLRVFGGAASTPIVGPSMTTTTMDRSFKAIIM